MPPKAAFGSCIGALVIGLVTLSQTLSRPRLADVHTVDIVSLVAAGACFGAGLAALFAIIRARRTA